MVCARGGRRSRVPWTKMHWTLADLGQRGSDAGPMRRADPRPLGAADPRQRTAATNGDGTDAEGSEFAIYAGFSSLQTSLGKIGDMMVFLRGPACRRSARVP